MSANSDPPQIMPKTALHHAAANGLILDFEFESWCHCFLRFIWRIRLSVRRGQTSSCVSQPPTYTILYRFQLHLSTKKCLMGLNHRMPSAGEGQSTGCRDKVIPAYYSVREINPVSSSLRDRLTHPVWCIHRTDGLPCITLAEITTMMSPAP